MQLPRNEIDSRIVTLEAACVLLTCLASITLLVWGFDKGFDFQDEAFCALQALHPDIYPYVTSFGYITNRLPHVLANEVQSLRFWHLIVSAAGATILACGFSCWLLGAYKIENKYQLFVRNISIAVIGNLLGFTTVELSLGYNGLIASLLCAQFGISLMVLGKQKWHQLLIVSGILCAIAFFVKFSSCFLITFLCLVSLYWLKQRMQAIFYFIFGIILGVLVYNYFFQELTQWWQVFSQQLAIEAAGSHGLSALWSTFSGSLTKHWTIVTTAGLGAVVFIKFRANLLSVMDKNKSPFFLPIISFGLAAALSAYSFYKQSFHSSLFYTVFVTAAIACCTGMKRTEVLNSRKSEQMFVILSTTVLPLIISIGTDTPLLWHALGHIGPALMSVSVLVMFAVDSLGSLSVTGQLCVCLILQMVFNFVVHPHGLKNLVSQNTQLVDCAPLNRQKLDSNSASMIEKFLSALKFSGFKPDDTILGVAFGSGLVYIADAKSPGSSWYSDQGVNGENVLRLRLLTIRTGSPDYIIVCNRRGDSTLPNNYVQALRTVNIHFPEDYHLLTKAFVPDVYWQPEQPAFVFVRNDFASERENTRR